MNNGELFVRYEGNPILTPDNWPYPALSVFNPGAIKFNDEVLVLVRVEDIRGYSHLTIARSKDGETNWKINSEFTLRAEKDHNEAEFGLEDSRIVYISDRQEYVISCVSFRQNVTDNPPGISIISTEDFSSFKRVSQPLIPPNKDACLFPAMFEGSYALVHRPIVERREDIWVSFSPDLHSWEEDRVLLPSGYRSWDSYRIGLGPPPIWTHKGWLLIYHGARGDIYRVGAALLDISTLKVLHRSMDCIFSPRAMYERVGNKPNVVFPCGYILDKDKLSIYYGAADLTVCLATASLEEILEYLLKCPAE